MHKSVQKIKFDCLIQLFDIIKWPPISFPSKSLGHAQWDGPQVFVPLLPYKRVMSTQKVPSHRRIHHPNHFKERISTVTTFYL